MTIDVVSDVKVPNDIIKLISDFPHVYRLPLNKQDGTTKRSPETRINMQHTDSNRRRPSNLFFGYELLFKEWNIYSKGLTDIEHLSEY
ncbi:hypothetical protein EVAR_8807_1 [Eumeta japonica]|uniref:Uncharacterized protein n=1 Tax=Eumeta variegata TaxID=151549 RepID=A0A4C1TTX1_EUMVA|nr:hypothetical protein EVAR_8807_1 [Eumeta japonica]